MGNNGKCLLPYPTDAEPSKYTTIFRLALTGPPLLEGRAKIIAAVPNIPNLYDVRFVSERRIVRRIVHAGVWQSDPEGILAALIDHWRLRVTPELLLSEAPFNPDDLPRTFRRP